MRAEPLHREDRVGERRDVRERLARDAERADVDARCRRAPGAAALIRGTRSWRRPSSASRGMTRGGSWSATSSSSSARRTPRRARDARRRRTSGAPTTRRGCAGRRLDRSSPASGLRRSDRRLPRPSSNGPLAPSKTIGRLRDPRVVGGAEVRVLHADRLRLRLGLDRLIERHRGARSRASASSSRARTPGPDASRSASARACGNARLGRDDLVDEADAVAPPRRR